jgi:hypothetical protein
VAVNIYQAVKQAMQDLVAPQIESIKGEITALRAEVRGEVNALRGEMTGLDGKMTGLRAEVAANFARLDERLTMALDLRERIVALEARLTR